jgi:F-type H+-transporting ATPase subunit gamma
MSESTLALRRKIDSVGELQTVVRTMKAMAAARIGQYQNAADSLDAYYRTVQLALTACFRQSRIPDAMLRQSGTAAAGVSGTSAASVTSKIGALVLGSDQGMVGSFNDAMVEFVIKTLAPLPGKKTLWPVGERMEGCLAQINLSGINGQTDIGFCQPDSIDAITALVGQILARIETLYEKNGATQIYLFHHRPEQGAAYAPVALRLLPLDVQWRHDLCAMAWPTHSLPEVMQDETRALSAFVREYLFVSIFRAVALSLASENASRLAAMQRAEKNIDELLEQSMRSFHRLRQSAIDEELFDVVSGFEALGGAGALLGGRD